MDARLLWRKTRWSIAHRGLAGTLRAGVGTIFRPRSTPVPVVHPFDQRYGTDTGGLIGGGALASGSENDVHITAYAGVPPSRLRAALDRWMQTLEGDETVQDFNFVDLGCGKGRAMLLASERPFRGVLGVELNSALAEMARQNVQIYKGAVGVGVKLTVICEDATKIVYPEGSLLVFIYNSFGPSVVGTVLKALERHSRETGGRIDLLFQNEGPEMPLRTHPRLALLWTGALPLSDEDAGAELAGSPGDITSLYRWVG